jgi:PAS domain S-box-containing protein
MALQVDPVLTRRLQHVSRAAALSVAFLGALTLAAWFLGIDALRMMFPSVGTIRANTAVSFVLLGFALWLLQEPRREQQRAVLLANLLASLVIAIAIASLIEEFLGWNLWIDEMLVLDRYHVGPGMPGRMTPVTAVLLVLGSLGVLLLDARGQTPATYPATAVAAIALVILAGYLYQISILYSSNNWGAVALGTTLGALLIAVGILTARPHRGLAALLSSRGSGSAMLRRLLVPAIVLPLLIGWLRLEGQRAGLYGTEIGLAIFAITTVIAFITLIALTARSLNRGHAKQESTALLLKESEEQYRTLFERNPHPMWVYDRATLAFVEVNDAATEHYGYSREEFLGMTAQDIRPPEDVAAMMKSIEESRAEPYRVEHRGVFRHRKKDGTVIHVDIANSRTDFLGREAWLVLATDVTEKRSLEAQVLQSQKMESIGQLAGGVAHDFNNILGVITGYAELLERRLPDDPRLKKYVHEIAAATQRATGLTRQLLTFSRKQVQLLQVLDLNQVVSGVESMLKRLIGEDITLVNRLASDLGMVTADPGQVEQVLMNLVVNARDALPVRNGRVTVETANVELDEEYARSRAGVHAGAYVMLAVSDNGTGMAPEVLAHLFEPFFTTKEAGRGTGLGLATVHGIVKQSGGHVFVYSEPGRGTTFKIYFPRAKAGEPSTAVPPVRSDAPTGTETILLSEDDDALRSIVSEALHAIGYTVLAAQDVSHALDLARTHAAPIHLLITDVVMPVMSGNELAQMVGDIHPEARVLFMSGYTDDAIVRHGVLGPDVPFLQKPFTTHALARKVRSVLDGAVTDRKGEEAAGG